MPLPDSVPRDDQDLRAAMAAIVGGPHVHADPATLELVSEDIWAKGEHRALLVVAPGSTGELAEVLAQARRMGLALAPRGGGMSYTGAYLPGDARSITLDMRRMDRILAIRPQDMTVTVEAGCTWAALHEALEAQGLRTPFWGPMSGLYSTVGGGLSQLNAMFGAGHYGTTSESLIALTMVLGDGQVLRTGARGTDGDSPFYRHYGPDLAGLFCGDGGTLGIKAEITLRLIRKPAHHDSASFSFKTGQAMLDALAEMARAGLAAESCGFDPGLTAIRLKRMSLAGDVKALGAVVSGQKSLGKGLLAAAKMALAGRDFVEADDYPLHITAEGRSREGVASDMVEARAIARRHDGVEIEPTIARVLRAMPFPPPNSILGPQGESWVPVHGLVSLSAAPAVLAEIQALFADEGPLLAEHDIQTGFLFTHMSTNAITIEPVFFWPEGYRPIHAALVEPAHLARLKQLGPNPAAHAVVSDLREAVKAIFVRHGAAHFQIGRAYDYRGSRDEASLALLDAVKVLVDPAGALNPGVLGFPV